MLIRHRVDGDAVRMRNRPVAFRGFDMNFDSTWVSDQAVAELQAAIPGLAVSRVGRPSW